MPALNAVSGRAAQIAEIRKNEDGNLPWFSYIYDPPLPSMQAIGPYVGVNDGHVEVIEDGRYPPSYGPGK
jgi:hypothetical protein